MDIQKTLSAIVETFTPSCLEESVQQIKALSLNDPPNLNYLSNLILQKVGVESDMTKDYARLCAALQEIDVFKAVLIENCKIEFEKVIDKHIRMKSRHQEFFMSMTRGVLLNDEPSDIEEENKLRCMTMRLCSFIGELFLLKVLASKAVCRCIDVLLTANDDFSLDCLCTLLCTCGKQLEENLKKKGSETMEFYFSSINIVTVYNEKFNISNEVAYKARRLAALREMTWDIRVDVEKQVLKNQEAKKKAKKEKKRHKKDRDRRPKEGDVDKDFSETDTNDKDEFCYRGRSDITISPSTFPRREITKECPHKNEIFDVVMDVVEDLVEEKDFRRSAQYVESYFSGSEKKNVFLTKLIQYVLDKNSVYRYAVGELLADLVKSAFYQPHQMMQQLIFLFNESQHLLIDIPCLWYNVGELYGALIREEYITLPDLKAAIETAGFKRTEASANFVCNLLTVLRHNEVIRKRKEVAPVVIEDEGAPVAPDGVAPPEDEAAPVVPPLLYKCIFCDNNYNTKEDKAIHIYEAHEQEARSHKYMMCRYCYSAWKNGPSRKIHETEHHTWTNPLSMVRVWYDTVRCRRPCENLDHSEQHKVEFHNMKQDEPCDGASCGYRCFFRAKNERARFEHERHHKLPRCFT